MLVDRFDFSEFAQVAVQSGRGVRTVPGATEDRTRVWRHDTPRECRSGDNHTPNLIWNLPATCSRDLQAAILQHQILQPPNSSASLYISSTETSPVFLCTSYGLSEAFVILLFCFIVY